MTAAVEAMVEAIGTELLRQAESSPTAIAEVAAGSSTYNGIYLEGEFDLDKVARAFLAALRDQDGWVPFLGALALGPFGSGASAAEMKTAFAAMIDAILKETP